MVLISPLIVLYMTTTDSIALTSPHISSWNRNVPRACSHHPCHQQASWASIIIYQNCIMRSELGDYHIPTTVSIPRDDHALRLRVRHYNFFRQVVKCSPPPRMFDILVQIFVWHDNCSIFTHTASPISKEFSWAKIIAKFPLSYPVGYHSNKITTT